MREHDLSAFSTCVTSFKMIFSTFIYLPANDTNLFFLGEIGFECDFDFQE
jgi:hypothetical protein